jgi:hypothetical protein
LEGWDHRDGQRRQRHSTKPKAQANAKRDAAAAPLDPTIQAITDTKNAIVAAHAAEFPDEHGDQGTKKPHVIRAEITKWVGDADGGRSHRRAQGQDYCGSYAAAGRLKKPG